MAEFNTDAARCPLKRLEYDEKLKNEISRVFYANVIPLDFIAVVKKYSNDILNKPDESHVLAETRNKGDWTGAILLLEKVTKYEDWFQCILHVLCDEFIKKDHIANDMLILKGKVDQAFALQDVQKIDGSSVSSTDSSNLRSYSSDVKNDFDLSDQEPALSHDGVLQSDSAKRPPNEEKLPTEPPHGTDYDFTAEEVKSALGRMRGWLDITKEEEVWTKLTPLRRENGHYLLCFLPQKKRPAIFVTHDKRMKLFLIHKKPYTDHRDQVAYYFIYKNQKKEVTMSALVDYHIEKGLVESSERGKSTLVRLIKAVEP